MGTNELIAEVGKHVPYAEIMDDAKWCIHCADEWPCVTRRLADALEASEARVKELEAGIEWEYGLRHPVDGLIDVWGDIGSGEEVRKIIERTGETLVRRRKAGPWLPVEGESR